MKTRLSQGFRHLARDLLKLVHSLSPQDLPVTVSYPSFFRLHVASRDPIREKQMFFLPVKGHTGKKVSSCLVSVLLG